MSSSGYDSDGESDITEQACGVDDILEELAEAVDDQVAGRSDANQNNEEGNNHDDGPNRSRNEPPRIPTILNSLINLVHYDEQVAGRDYNLLKEKHSDQLRIMKIYGKLIQERVEEIRSAKKQIKALENQLKGTIEPVVPWSHQLRDLLRGEGANYSTIYRNCCKQENMSLSMKVLHPDLNLELKDISEYKLLRHRERAEHKHDKPPGEYLFHRRFMVIVLPGTFFEVRPIHHRLLGQPWFPLERLPIEIQVKIFARVFVKEGLIHCLSRLDPKNPPLPEDFPEEDVVGCSQLPTGFHYGPGPCHISLTRRPNDVLSPLLVCKRWYYIGVHAFYGANTFAFSSLGEWHRFCNGIGMERVERLANVELMWHGSSMRRHESKICQRSVGLSWFTKTRRLRTLVVHIQESGKARVRRRHEHPQLERNYDEEDGNEEEEEEVSEQLFVSDNDDDGNDGDDEEDEPYMRPSVGVPFDPVAAMMEATTGQPNNRKHRSMRNVKGMDYLYQLRGMNWIRFKERDGPGHRWTIVDSSFIDDIGNAVTQPKLRAAQIRSELRYLTPLKSLRDWIPSEEDLKLIGSFYDESPNVDWVYGYGNPNEDEDVVTDSDSEEEYESDESSVAAPPLDDEVDMVAPVTPATTVTPPATPRQRVNGKAPDRDQDAGQDADDDDDRSSGLFVSSRSGSVVNHVVGEEAGSSSRSAGPFKPIPHRPIKVQPTDGRSKDQPIDLTTIDDNNGEGSTSIDPWDYDSDPDRFVKEETPPDQDDSPPPPSPKINKRGLKGKGKGPEPKRRKLAPSDKDNE
ncbi:hypothetical protein F4805DRAFT_456417 [Annulohypoxylon moriforme]|nr:hypothetical protein F4805DRAFT_456417 [Annulohypoxylon moriforme]